MVTLEFTKSDESKFYIGRILSLMMKFRRRYEGFMLEFIIPSKILEHLRMNEVELNNWLSDDWYWFELTLFDVVDPDNCGKLHEEFGNSFRVSFSIPKGNHPREPGSNCFQQKRPWNSTPATISVGIVKVRGKSVRYAIRKRIA